MVRRGNTTDIDRLVSQYLAAWNETDSAAQLRHLHATWSEAGVFVDPLVRIVGRDALHQHIARCQASYPGSRFVLTGKIAHHHDQIHFSWALLDAQARELVAGRDFVELDELGRIHRLVAFFNAPARPGQDQR